MKKDENIKTTPEEVAKYDEYSVIPADEFTTVGSDIHSSQGIVRESISYWKDARNRLLSQTSAKILIAVLVIIALCAIIIPMLSPFTISEQHLDHTNIGMFSSADGHMHIFGTDGLGRDLFVRIWSGARISLFIALTAVIVNCVVGIVYGGISGYFGGIVDNIMMRILEIINGIPYLLIVILLMVILPKGVMTIVVAYSLVGWIGMARLVRGQIMQLKEQEFVISAKTMGAKSSRIIFRHLIPNLLSIVIVNLTLSIPSAIFTEAFLSFIGLGVPIPNASWGMLANDGIINFQSYPYQLILPAFFISITMLSFNLLGDKLRDAFDPKLRR
jgi:oligopeptide transport system permease protein